MRFRWIIIRFLQFGAAGLFLLTTVAFGGNDSPIRTRSVGIDGVKSGYPLASGATSFVMRLTKPAQGRSVTFVNENAAAEGQLSIAVSSQSLAIDSPDWGKVEGVIRFQRKRVFTVSLLGIDANYVRLTFQVEAPKGNAKNGSSFGHPQRQVPLRPSVSAVRRGIFIADQASVKTLRP